MILGLGFASLTASLPAARDLLSLWIAEKRANGESVPSEVESMFTTVEIPDHALQGA